MIKITDVQIGTKFEIEVTDSLGGKIGGSYISQLLDIKDDKNITIAAPIQESRLLLIPTDSTVRCTLLHKKHGMVAFMGILTGKEKQSNLIVFNIGITSELYKIQRRNHFRLDCTLDAKYRIIGEDENINASIDLSDFNKSYTKDISGCGACLVTEEEVEKGKYLHLVLYLDDNSSLQTKCLVVRCSKLEDHNKPKFSLGLQFIELSKNNQEEIIKFIFNKQKQLLKRKLSHN